MPEAVIVTDHYTLPMPQAVIDWFESLPLNTRGKITQRTKKTGRRLMESTVMRVSEELWRKDLR